MSASIAESDRHLTVGQVKGFIPIGYGNIFFVEIDHEILSVVILSLPLIQERQLSVSEKDCAQVWLTA